MKGWRSFSLRWRRGAWLLALLAPAGVAAAPAAPSSGFVQYEQTTTVASLRQAPLKAVNKLWFKGARYRREEVYAGKKVLTLRNADGTFVMLPGQSGAVELAAAGPPAPRSAHRTGIPGLTFLDAATIARTAKKVGTEKVGRYSTTIYEARARLQPTPRTPPQEQVTRYWVSRELPMPVKVLMQSPPSTETVSVLQKVQLNIPVPDRMFQLPKGTPVRRLTPRLTSPR